MRKYVVFHLSTLSISYRLSPNGLVAYTSAYPIILQKELATGCPVPINYNFNRLILFTFLPWFISEQYRHSSMVCDCWKAPKDSVSHGLCMQGGEECQPMCKPTRKGMICLVGRNNVIYGSRSWKSGWQGGQSAHYHSFTTTNTSQNITFYTLYMLSKT